MSRKSARQSVDINVRSVLNRERSARSMRLPQWSLGLLDGEGRVRGRTWRQMPGTNPVTKACNWWLWKRNKLDLSEAMTEERAVLDCSADEERGGGMSAPAILDPCCGSRMWWFDKVNPAVIFGDRRSETLTVTDRSHGRLDGRRVLRVEPDVVMDFRELPFPDASFHLVAFDPPHLVRAGKKSWLAAKYGKLGTDWREDLRAGFAECFRVLMPQGVLVFKWNETQVKVREVLELTPVAPLFGNTSGRKAGTHWIVFMKGGAA